MYSSSLRIKVSPRFAVTINDVSYKASLDLYWRSFFQGFTTACSHHQCRLRFPRNIKSPSDAHCQSTDRNIKPIYPRPPYRSIQYIFTARPTLQYRHFINAIRYQVSCLLKARFDSSGGSFSSSCDQYISRRISCFICLIRDASSTARSHPLDTRP